MANKTSSGGHQAEEAVRVMFKMPEWDSRVNEFRESTTFWVRYIVESMAKQREEALRTLMEGPTVPLSLVSIEGDSWTYGVQLSDDTIAWFRDGKFLEWGELGEPPPRPAWEPYLT